jgi:all-trans-retinol 13,14-reductase
MGDPDELDLPKHNLWYFHGYDLDKAFDEYFAKSSSVRPPVVYIGFPCTKDATWKKRFPGMSNCVVISDGLYDWFQDWSELPARHRGDDYTELKERLTKHLMDILYEHVPQIKGKVEYMHCGSPLTEETFLGSFRGVAYGTMCTPDMFAKINQRWMGPRTEIPGLYLAGSDAFFAGFTGAMYGGCIASCTVLGLMGSIRLGNEILSHLAACLKQQYPKLTWYQAYRQAIHKFLEE